MSEEPQTSQYAAAGVDIDAANRAKSYIAQSVRSTHIPGVLSEPGGFSGLFALQAVQLRDPVLVTSIDGVGTKLKVAFTLNRHASIGADLVAHCVNDILVCGARPILFLDYLALGRDIPPERMAEIVAGVAEGCRQAGCALIGGETAQMPGFYPDREYDLAGCIVGVVDREALITGTHITAGDVVIGLPSVGLHTNGYSLARKIVANESWTIVRDDLGMSLGDALLMPHRSYLPVLQPLLADPALQPKILGMAHITGGGLLENIPRVLPSGLGVDLDATRWDVLPIFRLLQQQGKVSWHEMSRVFNLGLGFVVIVHPMEASTVLSAMGTDARIVGQVVARTDGETVVVRGLPA